MNILITPDCPDWAIGSLTNSIIEHQGKRFNFFKVCVHPRGVIDGIQGIKRLLKDQHIDFWHAQYWRSATQLLEYVPELRDIPSLLTHHNHHCLEKENWAEFSALNEMTDWGVDRLRKIHPNVYKIPHGIDLDKFSYIEERDDDQKTIGYVGRVLPHKNLQLICAAAAKLGYKVIGSGYIDKPDYFKTCDKSVLTFHGGMGRGSMAPEQFKNEIYRKMSVFVMYSTGEKESGTLPLLEAMARGVPVMATRQGMARDLIEDGKNGVLFDEHDFEEKLDLLMKDREMQNRLRDAGWQTIKNYSDQKMARDYAQVYYKTAFKDRMVSIIIPTFNRADSLLNILLSIEAQDYEAKEVIVCDDGSTDETKKVAEEAKKQLRTNILYMRTGIPENYGLARSRNYGALEAMGEILLFLDDRYVLEGETLKIVAESVKRNTWCFGNKIIKDKAANKKTFVENFSWILREDFMKGGMFNPMFNMYGGISQDIRERYRRLYFEFDFVKNATVRQIRGTGRHKGRRDQIWKAKLILHKLYN